jgi:MFS superfamily sulfate permease-like transporter
MEFFAYGMAGAHTPQFSDAPRASRATMTSSAIPTRVIPGLVLFRWDAPLFFANAELFHNRVLNEVTTSASPVRWLVLAAEPITSVDVTSADMLTELDDTLHAADIELCFAEMKDPVKDKLKRFGLFERFGETAFFPTLGVPPSAAISGLIQ